MRDIQGDRLSQYIGKIEAKVRTRAGGSSDRLGPKARHHTLLTWHVVRIVLVVISYFVLSCEPVFINSRLSMMQSSYSKILRWLLFHGLICVRAKQFSSAAEHLARGRSIKVILNLAITILFFAGMLLLAHDAQHSPNITM